MMGKEIINTISSFLKHYLGRDECDEQNISFWDKIKSYSFQPDNDNTIENEEDNEDDNIANMDELLLCIWYYIRL